MNKSIFLGALAVMAGFAQAATPPMYDLLIVNGRVFDGDGRALEGAEIAIQGDRIVAVDKGLSQRASARRTIDARGMIVAPGFVDPHTHAAAALTAPEAAKRANLAWAFQGVTTVVVGNDGDGLADPARATAPTGTNYAFLSGFGRVRREVIGEVDRAPTAAELTQMQQAVARDMCAGALGFSTGLYYAPQSFAATPEVIALASVAAKMGGYYDTHLRVEGNTSIGVLGALDEALEITEKAGLPLHVAHIKALGPAVWGKAEAMIERIEKARASGRNVTADQYPWDASGTRVSSALLPRSAVDGGMEAMRRRLADPAKAAEIEAAINDNIGNRGGADRLLVTGIIGNPGVAAGKTLAQLASEAGSTPAKVAMDILRKGDANLASFNMSAENIKAFAYKDWVVTGSDGSTGHPRMYASFPKAWNDLVREGNMSIGRFIARSSGDTVKAIGLEGRGFLRSGLAADIVILDPDLFKAVATYVNPTALSAGVQTLIVNGVAVIENGKYTGALPGKQLKKTQTSAQCGTVPNP
ncbi:amidohydrolase family protein [Massilia sp. TS11]|uniref:N-acyl-D-amino-acid deacylase family protein n=1 Tax=Massilia sp. TS11 TaxID=2908003 RepID=UPI001EDA434E|nr:amidohydrolase family protein [Massilia sp. TS11]MCG2586838.1 amidohydrolase family protein [Massilia sp. TS11]